MRVGKTNYGSPEPLEFQAFDFSGLLNIESLPQNLADNELTIATNVYGDVTGGLRMRRGMTAYHSKLSSTACQGITRFFQQVIAGTPQSTPVAYTLAQIGGTLWNAVTNTQIGSTNALGASAQPWSVAQVYDPDYSGGATDCLVICTGSGGPYLFNGTTISTPSGWSAASGARWCVVSNASLWFGGIPGSPNLLWQSQPQHPELYGNQFVASLPVTGLSSIGAGSQSGLVYSMTKGLGVTFGVNLYNYYHQEIPHVDGFYGRTMVSVNGLVYMLGDTNIYVFDGQNIVPIGKKIRPWIINDPNHQEYPMNGARSLSFAWYYNQYIYFAYDSGNLGYCNTYLVYHIDKQGWTVLTGPNLSAACLLDAPIVDPTPHACIVADAQIGQVYNWDVFDGNGINGHQVTDLVASGGSAVAQNISTQVLTKFYRLTSPGTRATLKTVFPEYFIDVGFNGSVVVSYDYGTMNLATSNINSSLTNVSPTWAIGTSDFVYTADGGTPTARWAGSNPTSYLCAGIQADQFQPATNSSYSFIVPQAYSFAFGCSTNDNNPPYVFAGVSGTFIPEPRIIPDPGGTF